MKILIIGLATMKYMPYSHFYLDVIDGQKHEVHISYWCRDEDDEDLSKYHNIKFHQFRLKMSDDIPKQQKLRYFYKYRKHVIKLLRTNNYDKLIILHSLSGLMLVDKLMTQYRHKYILDYRDSTFETNLLFKQLVGILFHNCKLAFTSSDGFRKYFPAKSKNIYTSHNLLLDSLNHRNERSESYVASDTIRISFWGKVRHLEHNYKILDRLGNDTRFEIHYYGCIDEVKSQIDTYCKKKHIANVHTHGLYTPTDRYGFVRSTDILHNSYFDTNTMLAMGNKYYDGLIFRIPQLCTQGSYMADRCLSKGVGFALNPDDKNYADKLYAQYTSIDWASFNDNCDKELNQILKEYYADLQLIKNFIE